MRRHLVSSRPPHVHFPCGNCRCRGCLYDAAIREHAFRGVGAPPALAPPTAIELLECRALSHVGPLRFTSVESERWWLRHRPHVLPWLRAEVVAGRVDEPFVAQYGASCLLAVPENREGDDDKPEYSWSNVDGHELLFGGIAIAGLLEGYDAAVVLHGVRSFAAFLTERRVIPEPDGEHIARELAVWGPRFVRYFAEENAPWLDPDGTPIRSSA